MSTMPALPLTISAPPPAAEAGMAAVRRGMADAGESSQFPQMLAAQRHSHQAATSNPSRTRADDAESNVQDNTDTQADDAALQLIATLIPGATLPSDQALDADALAGDPSRSGLARGRAPQLPGDGAAPLDESLAALRPGVTALPDAAQNAAQRAAQADTLRAAPSRAGAATLDARASLQAARADTRSNTGKAAASDDIRVTGQPFVSASAQADALAQPQGGLPPPADIAPHTLSAAMLAPLSPPSAQPSLPGQPVGATLFIAAPMGHPAWGQAMAQQVGHALQAGATGIQQAELRLDPPNLGPLRVTLQIQDNVAHAWFVSPHASVRQAVESALPHLAQQLADAGLSLGDTHVGSEQAGHQPQPQAAARQGAGPAQGRQASAETSASVAASPPPAAAGSHLLIDTYA